MNDDRQNPDKPRPNGHGEPTFVTYQEHHKTGPVTPEVVRGHARGADMETPAGHTTPTFVSAQPEAAGAVDDQAGLAEKMAKQKATQMDNQLGRRSDGTDKDRG